MNIKNDEQNRKGVDIMSELMDVLERARKFELEISAQVEHIERLHRIAARARESTAYTQSIVDKLEQLERELNAHIDRTCDAKLKALEYISILEGEERGVIENYYILAETWDKIALKMYMSDRRVFMLRKSALAKLEEYFEPEKGRRNYGNRKKNKTDERTCRYYTGGTCTAPGCDSVCCR